MAILNDPPHGVGANRGRERATRSATALTVFLLGVLACGLVGCQKQEIRGTSGFDALADAPMSTTSDSPEGRPDFPGRQTGLQGAIQGMVGLLESDQYDAFRQHSLHPEDREGGLGAEKAEAIKRSLTAVYGSQAAKSVPPSSNKFTVRNRKKGFFTLTFERYDGRWYLRRP